MTGDIDMKILKLTPAIKDNIWGGTRLSKEFEMVSLADRQAEAWVLSCHGDGESTIENTDFKGRTLSDVLSNEGKGYLGTNFQRLCVQSQACGCRQIFCSKKRA